MGRKMTPDGLSNTWTERQCSGKRLLTTAVPSAGSERVWAGKGSPAGVG